MSRSWPRVMSPTPGRSTLMTSAPSQASSCVQVGPDCTWVKSRILTPSSALPACPQALLLGRGRPLPFADFFASLTTFFEADFATVLALAGLDLAFAVVLVACLRLAIVSSPRTRCCAAFLEGCYFFRSTLCGLR